MKKQPIKPLATCDDVLVDCSNKLDAILQVSQSLMGVLDPNEVLTSVIHRLGKELGYRFPAIFLYDETRTSLVMKKIGVQTDEGKTLQQFIDHDFESIRFDISAENNLVVKAAEKNAIVVTRDITNFTQPFLTEEQSGLLDDSLDVHLIIGVPLILRGETIGTLIAFSQANRFAESEQALLQTLANQISIALYNAQLFARVQEQVNALEQREQDLETLLKLSEIARSSLDKNAVLQELLDTLPHQLSHVDVIGGAILLKDESLSSVHVFALTEGAFTTKVLSKLKINLQSASQQITNSPLLSHVLSKQQPQVIEHLSIAFPDIVTKSIEKKIKKLTNIACYAAIPLVHGDTTQGIVLFSLSKPLKVLNERKQELFEVITNTISVTLENAGLYDQLQMQYIKVQKQSEALEEANSRLKALDQAKSEFVSIASHQLRTPLTVIKGYLSLIMEGSVGRCDPVAMESIRKVSASTDRLVSLVNDLLDISRIERGILLLDIQPGRLELLAESVVDELYTRADKHGVSLTFHRSRKKAPQVHLDKTKIREVMMNMVDNAVKYTPHGGKIDVSVKKDGKEVIFEVKDTGMGLSEDTIPKLFEKFSRGEGVSVIDTEGVGLGLFVAKRVIDGHGGRIWATSKGTNKGSIFSFALPISKKQKK